MLSPRSFLYMVFSILLISVVAMLTPAAAQVCTDNDHDGYSVEGGACGAIDCDDNDSKVYPDALRICDAKDNDCDGRLDFSTDIDNDHDGVPWCANDCNDSNPNVYPGNIEQYGTAKCSDGLDNDCNKKTDLADPNCQNPCTDNDKDGYGNPGSVYCTNGASTDCNDTNPNMNPGVSDNNCNGVDDNCSGTADENYVLAATTCGIGACAGTGQNICQNGTVVNTCVEGSSQPEGPSGDQTCSDGIDNDCDGLTDAADTNCQNICIDNDGDGYGANGAAICPNGAAIDCNDNNPNIHPGALDNNCNGVDENCSGTADDGYVATLAICGIGGCARTGQNICLNGTIVNTCIPGVPQTEGPLGNPTCSDGTDNNCNGFTDAADPNCKTFCIDNDSDGFGSPGHATCPKGALTDCNDNDPKVYPGAPRICDGKDNDCDGRLDFSTDVDNDHDGVAWCAGDCSDNNANIYPGNIERYGTAMCSDGLDNDCNKKTDLSDPNCQNPCTDQDKDGYGNPGSTYCTMGSATDCNDYSASVNPGASDNNCNGVDDNCSGMADEGYVPAATTCGIGACARTGQNVCQSGTIVNTCTPGIPQTEGPLGNPICSDGIDNDCDGAADTFDPGCLTACIDNDGDGYGANGNPSCPMGTAIDCNDNNININPGMPDVNCNGIDENCDGIADDGYVPTTTTCGIGGCAASGQNVCLSGTVVNTCVPRTPQTEGPPGNATCSDGIDNNCNGLTDAADSAACNPLNIDNDHDGYCEAGPCIDGSAPGDCDDTDPKVYPGAPKICDGKDNNCDGRVDFSTDVDKDKDGYAVCAGDCNDNNPNVNPGKKEGPLGDPTCSDGLDNNCNGKKDAADPRCALPTCGTKTSPKNGPHFVTLLNPDGTVHPDSAFMDGKCGKCHNPDNFQDDTRFQCQRCHADPNDTSDPLNGTFKTKYPLDPPYGYGSVPNVKLHSSTVVGKKFGNWNPGCVTCHNPHQQEQDLMYETTYGMYVKNYVCFDNAATGQHNENIVEFTASSGAGSFADGPPRERNICETCHTRTNHHRKDGLAPGDLNQTGTYVGHYDGQKCTDCHVHSEGFKPSCGVCHEAPPQTGTHLKHFAGTKYDAEYGSTEIAQDVTSQVTGYLFNCGNCHPMDAARHMNGVSNSGGGDAEIELYNPNAPAGSLKALNPPTATYTPGTTVFTDSKGKKYTQGTCSNVYCHSGPEYMTTGVIPQPQPNPSKKIYPLIYNPPWENLVVTTRNYKSPTWGNTLGCDGCHGYPILTQYPAVSGGAGDTHAWIDDYGYLEMHMWNMSFNPIQCNTCHYDTVTENYTWTRDDFSIQLGNISIFNKSKHVNNSREVSFTPTPVEYNRSSGSTFKDLSTASYNTSTKTCSNVACHINQTSVKWGSPYRWWVGFECNSCHRM